VWSQKKGDFKKEDVAATSGETGESVTRDSIRGKRLEWCDSGRCHRPLCAGTKSALALGESIGERGLIHAEGVSGNTGETWD